MAAVCCGLRPAGVAGAALLLACQLCPHSDSYWRGREHVVPAPPSAVAAEPGPAAPVVSMPAPPPRQPVQPGVCLGCGADDARPYLSGWWCNGCLPGAGGVTTVQAVA